MSYVEMISEIVNQTRASWRSGSSAIEKYIKQILNQNKSLTQIRADFEAETGGEMFQRAINMDMNFKKRAYKTYLILCIVTEGFDVVSLWNFSKTEWEMY